MNMIMEETGDESRLTLMNSKTSDIIGYLGTRTTDQIAVDVYFVD